jgi:hypothetical protein
MSLFLFLVCSTPQDGAVYKEQRIPVMDMELDLTYECLGFEFLYSQK